MSAIHIQLDGKDIKVHATLCYQSDVEQLIFMLAIIKVLIPAAIDAALSEAPPHE